MNENLDVISAIALEAKKSGVLYGIGDEMWIYAKLPGLVLRDVIWEVARRNSVDIDAVTIDMVDEQFAPFRLRIM